MSWIDTSFYLPRIVLGPLCGMAKVQHKCLLCSHSARPGLLPALIKFWMLLVGSISSRITHHASRLLNKQCLIFLLRLDESLLEEIGICGKVSGKRQHQAG